MARRPDGRRGCPGRCILEHGRGAGQGARGTRSTRPFSRECAAGRARLFYNSPVALPLRPSPRQGCFANTPHGRFALPDPREAQTANFRVTGLDCPDELALVARSLTGLKGIAAYEPNYIQQTLRAQYDPGLITPVEIAAAIARSGLATSWIEPSEATAPLPPPPLGARWKSASTVLGGLLLLAAAAWYWGAPASAAARGLAVFSTAISAGPVLLAAARALRLGTWDMNVLMSLAALGAVATGDTFEAATAMFLFGVSLWLERYTLERARRAVRGLAELASHVAHRWQADQWVDVEPAQLAVGDLIRLRPGERLPVDGQVESGSSSMNPAAVTGESLPLEVGPGAALCAGYLNGEGSLDVRVRRIAAESTLARIARLVEQAQATRSKTERQIDRFARWYTPTVIVLAVLLALAGWLGQMLGWSWATQVPAAQWLHRSLVLLVIACPCALVISTPVTVVCGLVRAARQGFLIKGGQHLETAGRIRGLLFDKTGTLTTGRLALDHLEPIADGHSADELLALAAALESHSEHPVAAAIVDAARRRGLAIPPLVGFETRRGLGVAGEVHGTRYVLGSAGLLTENGLGPSSTEESKSQLPPSASDGDGPRLQLFLAHQHQVLASFWLRDELRPEAAAALAQLRALGMHELYLLTGDRQSAALAVARQLQIEPSAVFSELKPDDKLAIVRRISADRGDVAMVGDGVNDAPALAAAPLGIAWGRSASDTALETADVVALAPRLDRLPELFRLARQTHRILVQNISLSLVVKATVLVLAALGLAAMWLAVAADVGASLVVTINGMRLLQSGPARPQSQ